MRFFPSWLLVVMVIGLVVGGEMCARAQQPTENPVPVAGRPASQQALYAWRVDDLTTHVFDLGLPGATQHFVFNANGTFAEDSTPAGGGAAVHTAGTWKINTTDLELSDAGGTLLDYWRLLGWSEKQGTADIGLEPVPHAGRQPGSFRIAMRPPFARLVADTYEPEDDGGSLPLQEVTATPFTPETAHFEMIQNHVYMTFKIEGQTVHFFVDTGAYQSMISPKLAAALVDAQRKTDMHMQGFGPKTPEIKKWTRKVKLELPGTSCRASLMIYTLDLTGQVHPMDGLLGMDIMAQLRVRIDYLHQTITFSPPDAGTVPNERGIIVLSKRAVHIPVTMVSGDAPPLTGSMYVDTGAGNTLVIEHHPGMPLHGISKDSILGIGGEDKANDVRLSSVTFAGVTFRAPQAQVDEGKDGNSKVLGGLGGEMLQRFCLTLDLQHRHVYFDPYTAAMDDPNALPELPPAPPLSDEMKALLAKAQAGDAVSQRKLGLAYMRGKGIGTNLTEGAAWLQKAADQGDDEAQYKLAMAYAFGAGVTKDRAKSFAIAQKASANGAAWGQLAMGDCYQGGFGVTKDVATARSWYEKAAAQKNTHALSALQSMYWSGNGDVPVDLKKAFALGQQAAELGDAQAEYNLGLMYNDGDGTAKDANQARAWYEKAAAQDFADAAHNLARMYMVGDGLKVDKAQALVWSEKAADLNEEASFYDLVMLSDKSPEAAKYLADAPARFLQKVAAGNVDAMMTLARFYMMGLGVTQDTHTAVLWCRQAAKLGSADAAKAMGVCYASGSGVPQDDAQAVAWFQKGADEGNEDAMAGLGECYEFGLGVPVDLARAKELYEQAIANGSDDAKAMLAELNAKPTMDLVDPPTPAPGSSVKPFTKMAPSPSVGTPAMGSGLIPWIAADLADAQYDLVQDTGWLQQRGLKLRAIFRADGTMMQEDVDHTGAPPVQSAYHWKINGTDLLIADATGKQVNIWRRVGRYANGQIVIGLMMKEEGGAARVQRKFVLTKAASVAPVEAPVVAPTAPPAAPSAASQPPATTPANAVD